jgi:hypothetical protein
VAAVPAQSASSQAALPAAPQKLSGDSTIVNIPNSNGKFTPVKLTKYANGFIGPQGEFYPEHPTIAELKVLYGN